MDENFGLVRYFLGQAYAEKEMYPEAIAELEKAMSLSGQSPELIATLGYVYAAVKDRDQA